MLPTTSHRSSGSFHEDCEEKECEGVSLEGTSMDVEWGGVSVHGHIVCARGSVFMAAMYGSHIPPLAGIRYGGPYPQMRL